MKHSIIQFEKTIELPIYAASGLAKHNENFYVISDDEKSLFQFNTDGTTFIERPLQPGTLPLDPIERKKLKPDWESLVYFQQQTGIEGLLAVPSGSKQNRQTGYFIKSEQNFKQQPIEINFVKLYQKLQENFNELNIEGAAIINSTLKLLQRGNGQSKQNAIITLNLNEIVNCLKSSQELTPATILNIESYNLGQINNSPLSFTDAFAIDGSLYFLAVCEETVSTYEDGPFKGAILGEIDANNKLNGTWELNCPFKPEGLWIEKLNDHYKVYIVTDADSREQKSILYSAEFKK